MCRDIVDNFRAVRAGAGRRVGVEHQVAQRRTVLDQDPDLTASDEQDHTPTLADPYHHWLHRLKDL
jgi:hypothetical protein